MFGTCAVDELACQIDYHLTAAEHAHASRSRDVGHVCRLDILLAAQLHEALHILALDDDGHALLRLAYGELGRVKTAVLDRNAVEIYVQTVGQLAYGDADAAGAEVV